MNYVNQYFKMITKRIWILILIPFVSLSIAVFVSYFIMKPVYEAQTNLFVNNTETKQNESKYTISYEDILSSELLVKNYKALVKSRAITNDVIKELNLANMSNERLSDSIDVETINDSSMFSISVRSLDPNAAKLIADKVTEVFIRKAAQTLKINNIYLIDKADVPQKPVSPRHILILGGTFFISIIMAVIVIFVLEYADDTIGDSEDIEKITGVPVVGIIPKMNLR